MIKNMEWGAVAYLSHSKYGINKEMALNSANTYTTGCGPQSEGSTSSGSKCNAYDTSLGQTSSTTGNIYGIYDMSGGSSEYVMGNIVSPDGTIMMSGQRANTSYPNRHSGYDGILYYNGTTSAGYGTYDGTYSYPDNKYIDKYSFNTNNRTRSRSKLGDGIREVLNTSSKVWYSDNSDLACSLVSWFCRGGAYNGGGGAGDFGSFINYGNANTYYSSRLVISQ